MHSNTVRETALQEKPKTVIIFYHNRFWRKHLYSVKIANNSTSVVRGSLWAESNTLGALSYLSFTCGDEFICVGVFFRLMNFVFLKSSGTKPSTAAIKSPGVFRSRKSHRFSLPYTRQVSIGLPVRPEDGLQYFQTVDSHQSCVFGWTAICSATSGFQISLPGSDVFTKPGCHFWDLNCQVYRINMKKLPSLRPVTSSHLTRLVIVTFQTADK